MNALAKEVAAFEVMRAELLREHRAGYVVLQAGQVFGIFGSWEDAFGAAMQKYGTKTPFLIRRIEAEEAIEAPALVLGLIDPKVP